MLLAGHFRISVKPLPEAKELLDWDLQKPIQSNGCIYREMVCNEKEAAEVAQDMLRTLMLADERAKITAYFLSPEEVTGTMRTVLEVSKGRISKEGWT